MTCNYVKEEVELYINNHVEFLVVTFEIYFLKQMRWYLYNGNFSQACL